jgi:hypothetical protein
LGACAVIGADDTITVLVPIGLQTPVSNISVEACLRFGYGHRRSAGACHAGLGEDRTAQTMTVPGSPPWFVTVLA